MSDDGRQDSRVAQLVSDFLDGDLTDPERTELLAALEQDPELARQVAWLSRDSAALPALLDEERGRLFTAKTVKQAEYCDDGARFAAAAERRWQQVNSRPAAGRPWQAWLAAAAALALALAVGGYLLLAQPTALGLRLAAATGEVAVTRGGRAKPAPLGLELRQGDQVAVTAGGQAALQYDGEATRIDLQSATATFRAERGAKRVRLESGVLRCTAAAQPKPFRLETPHAAVEVVGTRFRLEAGREATTLAVTAGQVALRRDDQRLAVHAGETAVASRQGLHRSRPDDSAVAGSARRGDPSPAPPAAAAAPSAGSRPAASTIAVTVTFGPRADLGREPGQVTLTPGDCTGKASRLSGGDSLRPLRLADGRLLGLSRGPGQSGIYPFQVRPEARALGPSVPLDAAAGGAVQMAACDTRGRYLMAAVGSDQRGGRVVIWDLECRTVAADLGDLPRTPHPRGDFGFSACAVAPDGTLGAAADSGGGLLILELPAGAVRHRLALPAPATVNELGRDLAWENGELVARGWPTVGRGTIRIAPETGVIRERFDHPVIRRGACTIHIRGDRVQIVELGTPERQIPLPPNTVAGGGWRWSADGRWLAGGTPTASPLLLDLREGRCLSPVKDGGTNDR